MRAFRHRDFRLLWTGAFFSFMGSWIQNIAQGWLVYDLTHDKFKLALVTFCQFIPVSIFGPVAGVLADTFDKRTVLCLCQVVFGCGALFLAFATYQGFVRYEHILLVATIFGCASAIETPTRQTIVSRVVPPEDLPNAVPLQALTFNLSRLLGPVLGGLLLAWFGPQMCYLVNGLSYLALIAAVMTIRADLKAEKREPQPIGDLLTEGMLYTFRERRLKTLFIMEASIAMFGLPYLALMPAIARDVLGLGEAGLGMAMAMIGVGAVTALVFVANVSDLAVRAALPRVSMAVFGVGLLGLGFASSPWIAFPLLSIIGMSAVAQFNSTNTLFQLLSPDRLRGRVIAMHFWALSGLNPIGAVLFGWIAKTVSISFALQSGAVCVLVCALWAWTQRRVFTEGSSLADRLAQAKTDAGALSEELGG